MMSSPESRSIFARVKDDTSSLLWLRDAESAHTRRSSHSGSEDLGTLNTTFTFDLEVLNSRVYQTSTRSQLKLAPTCAKAQLLNIAASRRPALAQDQSIAEYFDIPTGMVSGPENPSNEIVVDPSAPFSSDDTRKSTETTADPQAQPPDVEAIKDDVAKLNLSKERIDSCRSCRYYDIYDHKTLGRLLAGRSVAQCTPRPKVSWSLPAPRSCGEPVENDGASAARLIGPPQQFGPHSQRTEEAGAGRPDKGDVKVLVLGISDSGKTTLQKSMKIAFGKVDKEWRLSHRPTIFATLAQNLKALASKTVWNGSRNSARPDGDRSWYTRKFAKSYRIIDELVRAAPWEVDDTYTFPPAVASALVDLSRKSDVRALHDQLMLEPGLKGKDCFIHDCTKQYVSLLSVVLDFQMGASSLLTTTDDQLHDICLPYSRSQLHSHSARRPLG